MDWRGHATVDSPQARTVAFCFRLGGKKRKSKRKIKSRKRIRSKMKSKSKTQAQGTSSRLPLLLFFSSYS
jgi:hypothetical protein